MEKHIFHLVLNRELKNNIKKLSKKMKLSVSKAVIHIIKLSLPILEKYQLSFNENDSISKYNNINWDSHIHIYFDEILYRKIRHISSTMFAFSLGIIIRKLLNLFFEKSKKYKKIKYREVLSRYNSIFIKKNKIKSSALQLYGRGLFYQLSYNLNFNLIGICYRTS